jgi:hypothetical protein
VISKAARPGMAQLKQAITLLTCCQSTLGHASKQPNTCADVEAVESSANRNCNISFNQTLHPSVGKIYWKNVVISRFPVIFGSMLFS